MLIIIVNNYLVKKIFGLQFPLNLTIGNFSIPFHLLLETAAIFIGFRYFLYLRKKHNDNIPTHGRMWIVTGAIFGSVLGSRLLGGIENIPLLMESENVVLHFYANKTIVGGLLGGLAGVEAVKKIIGEKQSSGDLFTYPLILAMIIGRIGCFSMGIYEETYGHETSLFTGMNLGDGKLRHPVTLYEIVFLFALWLMLMQVQNKFTLASGGLFKLFMIFYLLFRLLLDLIKPHFTFPVGLSSIQIFCVLGLIYYSPFIVKPKKLLAAYA